PEKCFKLNVQGHNDLHYQRNASAFMMISWLRFESVMVGLDSIMTIQKRRKEPIPKNHSIRSGIQGSGIWIPLNPTGECLPLGQLATMYAHESTNVCLHTQIKIFLFSCCCRRAE